MAEGFKDVTMQNKDTLKIAVTGCNGSGKSSFINTFCGLSAKGNGAKVGVTSTNEIKSYPCHENDNIVLFEIPSVGSTKFLKATSLEDIGFGEFDFFIIISSSLFTEDDVWLGKMAKEHRKKCFYVRTKIDFNIISDRYNKGDAFNEAATIEKVRQEARKCLSKANVDAPIYLIATRMRHSFDFTSLVHDVNGSAAELKENAQQKNTTDVYDAISEKDQSLIKSVYKEKGATGLKDVIMQNKVTWTSQPLKIAVTGNSGSGKSSFINAFCGLSARDEMAPVGVTERSNVIRSYTCTGNDKFVLFDLPGVGTAKFPKESYLRDIEFEKFHFFIIISSSRFTENDAWLGKAIRKHRKQCFFVRTKVDKDIDYESYEQDADFNEAETIELIRKDARKCLNEANIDIPVYLISTRLKTGKTFEFSSLKDAVNESAMELKKNPLLDRFSCGKRY